jgi:hypothetical protein
VGKGGAAVQGFAKPSSLTPATSLLVAVFGKSQQANLSKSDRNFLARFLVEYEAELKRRGAR